jgi:anti-sigma regulatory factor (Ser/Thr protein kinase)
VSGSIEVAPSLEEALALAARRPATIRERHRYVAEASTPQRARTTVRQACSRWGIEEVADEATLVTSELVTNALRHGQGAVQLHLSLSQGALRIGVADRGDNRVAVRPAADPMDLVGRGLVIVAAVADSWGVKPRRGAGKEVWAVLRLPEVRQHRAS